MLGLVVSLLYLSVLNTIGVFDGIWSPVFIMGIALCFVYRSRQVNLPPAISHITILFLFLVIIFMTPAMQFYFFGYRPQLTEKVVFIWSVVNSTFCYFCLRSTSFISKLLKGSFLTIIGKWSFSIYLFYWAVIMICASYNKNDLAVFIFAVVRSVG